VIVNRLIIEEYYRSFSPELQHAVENAAERIIRVKKKGGRVAVHLEGRVNVHEGVTTLVAELMYRGIVDAVLTSAAIVNHEMSGVLERVKQVQWQDLAGHADLIPRNGLFEITLLSPALMEQIGQEVAIDISFYRALLSAPGEVVVRVAGHRAYPGGLRTEVMARDVGAWSRKCGVPFEQVVGYGADSMTMIGAGARLGLPVLVTIPNLAQGGAVGLAVGDSIALSERARRIGQVVDGATLIIESGVESPGNVYGGPFETSSGQGLWTGWQGGWTYSNEGMSLLRINSASGERAGVDDGPGPDPVPGWTDGRHLDGDIGKIWPVLAVRVADALGSELAFMSYSRSSPEGEKVRQWIVHNILPADKQAILRATTGLMSQRADAGKNRRGKI